MIRNKTKYVERTPNISKQHTFNGNKVKASDVFAKNEDTTENSSDSVQ